MTTAMAWANSFARCCVSRAVCVSGHVYRCLPRSGCSLYPSLRSVFPGFPESWRPRGPARCPRQDAAYDLTAVDPKVVDKLSSPVQILSHGRKLMGSNWVTWWPLGPVTKDKVIDCVIVQVWVM